MSHTIVRTNAIIPLTAGIDLTGHEGRPIVIASGEAVLQTVPDGGLPPLGVLLKGATAGETVSVAVAGSFAGTVRVKLAGAVTTLGSYLCGDLDGEGIIGFKTNISTNHHAMAIALETGVEGEMIEAAIFRPASLEH